MLLCYAIGLRVSELTNVHIFPHIHTGPKQKMFVYTLFDGPLRYVGKIKDQLSKGFFIFSFSPLHIWTAPSFSVPSTYQMDVITGTILTPMPKY